MNATAAQVPPAAAHRIEELGRIILAYSEVTEKLQQSHDQLTRTVQALRNELCEKNRLLERRNRLAALGEMAAGLAHEIRNPLGGIQLYASMLASDVSDRPGSAQTVRKISDGVKRLDGLVSQVLQFSREMVVHPVEMDLAEVVRNAVELASGRAGELELVVDGPRALPVFADPMLLGQALLNLLLNGIEAAGESGRVEVRYWRVCANHQQAGVSREGPEGDARQFHLVVQDNGAGIPAEMMDRIFNPFFTTKETGTGLGLAIVHRIVEAHDGSIMVRNARRGGARFEIRI
jgi:signal transduction histidine kinase